MRAFFATGMLLVAAIDSAADTPAADVPLFPSMNFVSSVAREELLTAIKSHDGFGNLEKALIGSPIALRVTHSLQPTGAGKATGLLSAIWSGGTLGILPVVTNNSLVVRYEVMVHGSPVASYSYERSFTRAVNIWAADDATHGLGQDGLDWLKSTASEFATQAVQDAKLAELKREYDAYFGAPAANTTAAANVVAQ